MARAGTRQCEPAASGCTRCAHRGAPQGRGLGARGEADRPAARSGRAGGSSVKERYTRLAPQADLAVDASSRTASYIFSDESVGRDGHIIKSNAWRTDNFEKNPVFLWQHTDSVPPIGKVFGLHTETRQLLGSVKYAETDFA